MKACKLSKSARVRCSTNAPAQICHHIKELSENHTRSNPIRLRQLNNYDNDNL